MLSEYWKMQGHHIFKKPYTVLWCSDVFVVHLWQWNQVLVSSGLRRQQLPDWSAGELICSSSLTGELFSSSLSEFSSFTSGVQEDLCVHSDSERKPPQARSDQISRTPGRHFLVTDLPIRVMRRPRSCSAVHPSSLRVKSCWTDLWVWGIWADTPVKAAPHGPVWSKQLHLWGLGENATTRPPICTAADRTQRSWLKHQRQTSQIQTKNYRKLTQKYFITHNATQLRKFHKYKIVEIHPWLLQTREKIFKVLSSPQNFQPVLFTHWQKASGTDQ